MNNMLKIGIVFAVLALVDLILPVPVMWIFGSLILLILIQLTRHGGKPKRNSLVVCFIVAILVLILSYKNIIAESRAYYNTPNNTLNLTTLATYLQLLYVVLEITLVMLGFLIVLTCRYLRYKRDSEQK